MRYTRPSPFRFVFSDVQLAGQTYSWLVPVAVLVLVATVAADDGLPDWRAVDRLVSDWRPAAIVAGIPYNMAGRDARLTTAAASLVSVRDGALVVAASADQADRAAPQRPAASGSA